MRRWLISYVFVTNDGQGFGAGYINSDDRLLSRERIVEFEKHIKDAMFYQQVIALSVSEVEAITYPQKASE